MQKIPPKTEYMLVIFFLRPGFSEKHMACREKYKPCILKYKALILKYVPYIFGDSKSLINNNLQSCGNNG
mgnify:CR=1 FL=1